MKQFYLMETVVVPVLSIFILYLTAMRQQNLTPSALEAIKSREEKQLKKTGKADVSITKPKTIVKGGRRNG